MKKIRVRYLFEAVGLVIILITISAASCLTQRETGGPRVSIYEAAGEGVPQDISAFGKPTLLLVGDDRLARWKHDYFSSYWTVYNWSVSDTDAYSIAFNVMPRVAAGIYHSSILSLGVQDAMVYQEKEAFARALGACIRTLRVCSENVYVTTLPGIRPSSVYDKYSCASLNSRVASINEEIRKVVAQNGVTLIDLSPMYKESYEIKEEYTDDTGILYSAKGMETFYIESSKSMEK